MKLKKQVILYIALFISFYSYAQKENNNVINIFEKTLINFDSSLHPDGLNRDDSVLFLGNGRIALKKVKLPKFTHNTELNAKITLVSNGDPWDKSGSCFVIPSDSEIDMINIAENKEKYPVVDPSQYENLTGIVQGKRYKPTVELIRFMTPFGVGHYSEEEDSTTSKRKPVYIDSWAENVVWQEDISDLLSLFEEEVYVGIFIDTWTKEGYLVDFEISYSESNLSCDIKTQQHIEPLINTVYYLGQKHPDIFARKDVEIPFTIPENAKNIRLKYIASGHGGHSNGDEFRPQENILSIDNREIYRFTPWRNDCASFRRYNPHSGVWLKKRTATYIGRNGRDEKVIEEPLASSDLSRSNWCPGSNVPYEEIVLPNIKHGKHMLTISIPDSHQIEEDKLNHWLVSAYLIWDE